MKRGNNVLYFRLLILCFAWKIIGKICKIACNYSCRINVVECNNISLSLLGIKKPKVNLKTVLKFIA